MPSKKKRKTRQAKSKAKSTKKRISARKSAVKARASKRPRKSRGRTRSGSVSAERELRQEIRNRNLANAETDAGRQSDFQGLSRMEEADSESVDELVEEGNVFEAGAVAGVEEAENSDEREVHTHEVPEDDIPDEYLEKD